MKKYLLVIILVTLSNMIYAQARILWQMQDSLAVETTLHFTYGSGYNGNCPRVVARRVNVGSSDTSILDIVYNTTGPWQASFSTRVDTAYLSLPNRINYLDVHFSSIDVTSNIDTLYSGYNIVLPLRVVATNNENNNTTNVPAVFIQNPVQHHALQVRFPSAVAATKLSLYAIDGKLVFESELNGSYFSLPLPPNCSSGIYMLTLANEHYKIRKKLMIWGN